MESHSVHYVAKMVIHYPTTDEIHFQSRRIHAYALPENTTEGIMEMVAICNSSNKENDYVYVDMYGYEHDGVDILWEEE